MFKSGSGQAPNVGALNRCFEISLCPWIKTSGMSGVGRPSERTSRLLSLVVTKGVLRGRVFILTKHYKYVVAISPLIKKATYSSAFLPAELVLK